MLFIRPILENLWFSSVKSRIFQTSIFGVHAQSFDMFQWIAPLLKGFWASFFAVFERPLRDCSWTRLFINVYQFWSYFSVQNDKMSVPGGYLTTFWFFLDFWSHFVLFCLDSFARWACRRLSCYQQDGCSRPCFFSIRASMFPCVCSRQLLVGAKRRDAA